ncbi:hypothetical protein J6590_091723 [Homalodisca vitripennis]|nr:hypothetical protein J6590_091723 [Homalodisca vitripennis]
MPELCNNYIYVHVQACPNHLITSQGGSAQILSYRSVQDKAQVYLSISLVDVLRSISSVHTKGANYNSLLGVPYRL